MKIFSNVKSIKVTTKLIIILVLIIYLIGFFSIYYIWQVFAQINKINSQDIRASVIHYDTELIKDIYQKIENKK